MRLSHLCNLLPTRLALPAALFLVLFALAGCDVAGAPPTPTLIPTPEPTFTLAPPPTDTPVPLPTDTPTVAPTNTPTPIPLAERKYVPILAYHHVRPFRPSDTDDDRGYIVPPATLEKTLKYLKEKGYTGVVSQQVYDYYANGTPLPEKPVMLSFDDNDGTQYTEALPLLKKYGFNATFFIMTVTLDKENYMSTEQVVDLDKQGFDIQPHTWDHHMVIKYKTEEDWQTQIVEPKALLEKLLGHPTPFFAYPYGIYDSQAAEKIKSYGYKAAFRLSENMDDQTDPLFAIKRYIANPYFTEDQLDQVLDGTW